LCLYFCIQTDPESTDYVLEAGATRNFEASRTAEKMALQEQKEKEAEEANNPMKVYCSYCLCKVAVMDYFICLDWTRFHFVEIFCDFIGKVIMLEGLNLI
jgi:Saf4/Yju2 protein